VTDPTTRDVSKIILCCFLASRGLHSWFVIHSSDWVHIHSCSVDRAGLTLLPERVVEETARSCSNLIVFGSTTAAWEKRPSRVSVLLRIEKTVWSKFPKVIGRSVVLIQQKSSRWSPGH
jgi:hypothetical protein